jgi:hypothetical protein
MLSNEIIYVYSENHTNPTNAKYRLQIVEVAGTYNLPLSFKGISEGRRKINKRKEK